MDQKKWPATILVICLAAALALTVLHLYFVDLPNSQFQQDWHQRVISLNGPYPDQYRLLTFLLADWIMDAGVSFHAAYFLIRLVFTFGSLLLLAVFLRTFVKPTSVLIGLALFTCSVPFSYMYYSMQMGDPLNMFVFFGALVVLLKQQDWLMIPLVVIGMFNRETAILLPLLYGMTKYQRATKRWIPMFLILSALAWGIFITIRMWLGPRLPYAPTSPLLYLRVNLTEWQTWVQLFRFFNISLLLPWVTWKQQPLFLKRAALIIPFFLIIHLCVGYMREVRYFLPLMPILITMSMVAYERLSSKLGGRFGIPA